MATMRRRSPTAASIEIIRISTHIEHGLKPSRSPIADGEEGQAPRRRGSRACRSTAGRWTRPGSRWRRRRRPRRWHFAGVARRRARPATSSRILAPVVASSTKPMRSSPADLEGGHRRRRPGAWPPPAPASRSQGRGVAPHVADRRPRGRGSCAQLLEERPWRPRSGGSPRGRTLPARRRRPRRLPGGRGKGGRRPATRQGTATSRASPRRRSARARRATRRTGRRRMGHGRPMNAGQSCGAMDIVNLSYRRGSDQPQDLEGWPEPRASRPPRGPPSRRAPSPGAPRCPGPARRASRPR